MGDIVALVEKAPENIEAEQCERTYLPITRTALALPRQRNDADALFLRTRHTW
jgi:hypothetical protein